MTCRRENSRNPRYVGDPVDVVTGAMTDMRPDLRPKGPITFEWMRHYSSAHKDRVGVLGRGFRHEFEHDVILDLDGIRYETPEGVTIEFSYLDVGDSQTKSGVQLSRPSKYELVLASADVEYQYSLVEGKSRALLLAARMPGLTITFSYDNHDRLIRLSDEVHQFRISWNSDSLLESISLVKNNPSRSELALVRYFYDRAANLIRAVDFFGGIQEFQYDALNRMIRRTDRRGYSFLFEYDEQNRCIRSRGEDGMLDISLEYRPESRSTFVTHADGGRWSYFYDDFGNVTQVTDPYGFATVYKKDDQGRTVQEVDPKGNVTHLHYNWLGEHDYCIDANGHQLPTREEDDDPDDPLSYELTESVAEWENGQLVDFTTAQTPSTSDPLLGRFPSSVVNQFSGIFYADDPSEDPTDFERPDVAAELPREPYPFDDDLMPFSARSEFDFNGNLIRYQDKDGKSYNFTYQSWNLPFEEIDPLGCTDRFYYAHNLELSRAVDAGGTEHRFEYDLKNRLTEVYHGGKLLESLRYDACDNLIEKRDGQGRSLVSWDVGPRNLDRSRRLASGEIHQFEYDASGHVVKASSSEASVENEYDDDDRITKDLRDGLGVVHELSGADCLSTTYLNKFKVEYFRNEDDDLIIRDPTGAVHSMVISEHGLVMRHLANGTRELVQYDAEGRCEHKAVSSADGRSVWRRSFRYSPEGDLVRVDDSRFGVTRYEYDDDHRLSRESRTDRESEFVYDPANNVRKQPGLDHVEIADGNRLVSANGDSFTYDHRDNLTGRQGPLNDIRYRYDDLDRLVECHIHGKIWTATYDALDRRISKTWEGKTTQFYWDNFRLAAELRHDGSLRIYVYSDSTALVPWMLIDYESVDSDPKSGKRYYVFANHIGAPVRVDDDRGNTVWQVQLDPYGTIDPVISTDFDLAIRFPGHYHDAETGLHYNRYRYYSPELARYIQPDPLGIEGGINFFAYVDCPLIEVDIDGLGCRKRGKSKRKPKSKSKKKPKPKKPKSKRLQYLGRTPGKDSKTGRAVIARMRKEGKIRGTGKRTQFKSSDGNWYNLSEGDMAHKRDAVKYWNKSGREHGPKSKQVRKWMRDPDNYELEHYSDNRSKGASLDDRYKPPK